MSRKIANSLKAEWHDFHFCTDRCSFFSNFFDDERSDDVIVILSESVLKDMSITIDSLMKKYDVYFPVFTFMADFSSLIIRLNYIPEYAKSFSVTCIDAFQKIVDKFYNCLEDSEKSILCTCSEHRILHNAESEDGNEYFLNNPTVSDEYDILPQLTKAQRKLFTYLLSNKEGASRDEIAEYLWHSDIKNKNQNVYVLVSDLRSILKERTNDRYQIVYEHKKYRLRLLS